MKNKRLIIILVIIFVGVLAGLVYSVVKLNNANRQISSLSNELEKANNQINASIDEENFDNISIDNFYIDNNKENIKYLSDDNSIQWYRETIEYYGVRAVVADNDVYFFVDNDGINMAYTGQEEVTPYDNLSVSVDGANIIQAKFVQFGDRTTTSLVLVLSDGTVKYVSVNRIIEQKINFQTIEGLSDVVQVRGVAVLTSDGKVSDTAIVIKRDGTKELINEYFK